MSTQSYWLSLSVTIGLFSVLSLVLVAAPSLRQPRYLQRHFFFLFYYTATVVYLQVAPVLSQLTEGPRAVEMLGVAPAQDYVREYALVQAMCLLLFQVPLLFCYMRANKEEGAARRISANPSGASIVSIGMLVFSAAFLVVVAKNGLWFLRIGRTLAQVMVGLPTLDFIIFRSYQESALFLLGVLFFVIRSGHSRARPLAMAAFAVHLTVFGVTSAFNSRLAVTLTCVSLAGWWLATRPPHSRSRLKQLVGVSAAGLAALYLVLVAVNVRVMGWEGSLRAEYFNPMSQSALGDQQGIHRLNCVDLMARLLPELQQNGPAWGAAWRGAFWIVGRFLDPKGFDEFRLSETSAKSYLRSQYSNLRLPDYFSCTATDLFGNFHAAGLLVGAAGLAWLLSAVRRSWHTPSSGVGVVLGIFVITQIINFDDAAGTLLFGWTKQLPVLLLTLASAPFVVQRHAAVVSARRPHSGRSLVLPLGRDFVAVQPASSGTRRLTRALRSSQ